MNEFAKIIHLPEYVQDGSLTVLEKILPFKIKRAYWIYNSDGFERGGHRHIKTTQAFVAVSGKVEIYMNNGSEEKKVLLDSPNKLLLVKPEDWHTLNFTNNGIILVFASENYDPNDYIENRY